MHHLTFSTSSKKQVLDITKDIQKLVSDSPNDVGLCNIFVLHTTACVTTADLDPGTDQDYLDALDAMVPKLNYRHPHDPNHVGDHINSSNIGPQLLAPFENGKLTLGTWQRIVLVELDGPREREVLVTMLDTV